MKIQSSRIKNWKELSLLCYYCQKRTQNNCFEYTDQKSCTIVQDNPEISSIFTEKNENGITFPDDFDAQIKDILQKSNLQMPQAMIDRCLKIITTKEKGLLLREQNGAIRFIP